MQGLMFRLAELDANSAGLVRVIDYFDALIRHGADTAAMMRASAALANCVVGSSIPGRLEARRCDPRGQWSPQPVRAPSSSKDVIVDDSVVGTVWIEREGPVLPLDDMLVDRMALTAAIILQPRRLRTADELTTDLLFPMDDMAALAACAALGIDPVARVRVVVSETALSAPRVGTSAAVTVDADVLQVVAETAPVKAVRAGVSLPAAASEIHRFVGTARFARSRTSAIRPIVDAVDLGALNLLMPGGHLTAADIPDLARVDDCDAELVATLRVYLQSGTYRAAADRLHLHHSSVAHRLAKLSATLGFTVDSIENRARVTAMMMVVDAR
ncbi:helix-turn-helix domain-containing protein [Actinomycetes bacterium M1A6_2h]